MRGVNIRRIRDEIYEPGYMEHKVRILYDKSVEWSVIYLIFEQDLPMIKDD
jgi:hypothetical protein